jgi:hypothetical protein
MQLTFEDLISEKEYDEDFPNMYITDEFEECFTLHTHLTTIDFSIFE